MSAASYKALAAWIAREHPGLFVQLNRMAQGQAPQLGAFMMRRRRRTGLGDDGDDFDDDIDDSDLVDASSLDISTDDSGMQTITVAPMDYEDATDSDLDELGLASDADTSAASALALPDLSNDTTLAPSAASNAADSLGVPDLTPVDTSDLAASLDTSPDVSNVAPASSSGVSSVLSATLSAVGQVLASPVTAAAATAATKAYVASQATSAQVAAAQEQVISTQASRAAAGLAPANITYTADGTPVYVPTASASGLTTLPSGLGAAVTLPSGATGYTVTPDTLSSLSPTFLQQYGLWILVGGAALILALGS